MHNQYIQNIKIAVNSNIHR